MPTSVNHGVIGSDGVQPIYQPDGRWCWWGMHEIYTGTIGLGKYVPKVNDYVVDPALYVVYIVDHLDPVTLLATLREIQPAKSGNFDNMDILLGVGPGTQSDTYRCYYDTSVTPATLQVDVRLRVAGSMTRYCKIFKGSDLGGAGQVISKIYDSSGNFISENVPLEVVALDSHINHSIKMVAVCNVTEELVDAEMVTAVFYSDDGHVVSKRQLLVENTTFIRSVNASQKYITHISLETPFLSTTYDHLIEWPLNINMNALNLMGVVHYSNGEELRLPVNGTKFHLDGLDHHLSSIVGQKADLVLRYTLSNNETSYASVGTINPAITEAYSLITVNENTSYELKLFGYPEWVSTALGYRMRWYLLNLDRNVMFDATPHVVFDPLTGPFDPKLYGYKQTKSVSVNLRDVSPSFKAFRHVQIVDIMLMGVPDPVSTPWTISHESDVTRPPYGQDVFAKRVSSMTVNLASDFADQAEWIEKLYLRTYPLVNPARELNPIPPTHFILKYGATEQEFPITQWNQNLPVGSSLVNYQNVYLTFIRRVSTGELKLAVAGMMIKP